MSFVGVLPMLKIVAASTPFILMTLRSSKINLPKAYRGHQFLLPIIAIVYCLIIIVSVNKIALGLIRLVDVVTSLVSFIPVVGGVLNRWGSTFSNVLHMGYGVQLFCNTVVMTAFCGVKHAALPILNKFWTRWAALYDLTAGHFYEERGTRSILHERFSQMRIFFRVMYYTAVVLCGLDCVLAYLFSKTGAFQFPFYPVFGIIVLGEIFFFLDGQTLKEAQAEEDEKDDPDLVDVNFSKLKDALKKTFHGSLVT